MSGERQEPPRTGLDAVDRVLEREADVAALPVTERAAAYEALHAELEGILEQRPGSLPAGLTGTATGPGTSSPDSAESFEGSDAPASDARVVPGADTTGAEG